MTVNERFEALLQRPSYYFQTSEERQWQIDKDFGTLDISLSISELSDEQVRQWNKKFGTRYRERKLRAAKNG
jgi:hypothetical protein